MAGLNRDFSVSLPFKKLTQYNYHDIQNLCFFSSSRSRSIFPRRCHCRFGTHRQRSTCDDQVGASDPVVALPRWTNPDNSNCNKMVNAIIANVSANFLIVDFIDSPPNDNNNADFEDSSSNDNASDNVVLFSLPAMRDLLQLGEDEFPLKASYEGQWKIINVDTNFVAS